MSRAGRCLGVQRAAGWCGPAAACMLSSCRLCSESTHAHPHAITADRQGCPTTLALACDLDRQSTGCHGRQHIAGSNAATAVLHAALQVQVRRLEALTAWPAPPQACEEMKCVMLMPALTLPSCRLWLAVKCQKCCSGSSHGDAVCMACLLGGSLSCTHTPTLT